MSKFFDTIKSAIFEEVDEKPKQSPPVTAAAVPAQTVPQQMTTSAAITTPIQPAKPSYNSELIDKLCQRLEDENLPGPDYYELRSAVMDPDMVDAIPDINKRFLIAYKSLKAASPTLNKAHVITSIEHYTGCLRKWEKEALDEVHNQLATIEDKRQEVKRLEAQLAEIKDKISTLTSEVRESESLWLRNGEEMKGAVDFLIQKLLGDKEIINQTIKD